MPRQVNITDRSHPKEAGCGSMIYKDGGCNHIWSCEQRRRLLLRRRACTAQQPTPPQYHTPAHTLTRVGWVVGVRRQVRVPLVLAVLRPVLCHGQGQEGALPPPRELPLPLPLPVRELCVVGIDGPRGCCERPGCVCPVLVLPQDPCLFREPPTVQTAGQDLGLPHGRLVPSARHNCRDRNSI
jgi:hypothetical protein